MMQPESYGSLNSDSEDSVSSEEDKSDFELMRSKINWQSFIKFLLIANMVITPFCYIFIEVEEAEALSNMDDNYTRPSNVSSEPNRNKLTSLDCPKMRKDVSLPYQQV